MSKPILIIFLIFLFLKISYSQESRNRDLIRNLDAVISNQIKSIAPGCAVLIAKKGQIIYEKAFGMADLELGVLMKPDMVFRLGSITKQYTAVAILQLAEQGKLSLEDSIQKYIKDFPYKGHTITIENLLTQTSGIIDYQTLDFHIPNTIRIDFKPKQVIDSLKVLPLDFKTGSKYHYSNSNYFLLGYIIEKVSGKSYKEYMQQSIFKPLELANTFYDDPKAIIPQRVSGYSKHNENFINTDYISMALVYSAGALMTNIQDLLKWHNALYTHKLIRKETFEKAVSRYKLPDGTLSDYGYGWFIKDYSGVKTIGHGGAIDGFRSMECYLPDQDIFIATLFNSDDDVFFNLFEKILKASMGESAQPANKDLKLSESILDRYIGTYKYVGKDTSIKVTIKVYKENGRLFADLSNGTGSHMAFLPQSETQFVLAIKTPTIFDFIIEKGKVVKLIVTQKEKNEFKKIE